MNICKLQIYANKQKNWWQKQTFQTNKQTNFAFPCKFTFHPLTIINNGWKLNLHLYLHQFHYLMLLLFFFWKKLIYYHIQMKFWFIIDNNNNQNFTIFKFFPSEKKTEHHHPFCCCCCCRWSSFGIRCTQNNFVFVVFSAKKIFH